MRRTREQTEETRRQVLSAALEVFSRKGYAATTLEEIAGEAGLTRGAVYWHFEGKADLYSTLLEEKSQGAAQLWVEVSKASARPLEALRLFIVRSVELLEEDADYRRVLTMSWTKSEAVAELEQPFRHKVQRIAGVVAALEDLITRGIEAKELRADVNPRAAARAAYALMGGLVTLFLMSPELISPKVDAAAVVDLFIAGIVAGRQTPAER